MSEKVINKEIIALINSIRIAYRSFTEPPKIITAEGTRDDGSAIRVEIEF